MKTSIDTRTHSRREIVVGLDDSPAAAAALRWAADQAQLTERPMRVVHAWQLSSFEQAAGSRQYVEAALADARARATRWVLEALGTTAAEVRWSLDIVDGGPGQVLVERSRDALLLALGTREHTGLRRTILGSVSHYCLSHAVVPVVAVPRPNEEAAPEQKASSGKLSVTGPLL
jgi:nucleotide-binding universal stress UspA family protein